MVNQHEQVETLGQLIQITSQQAKLTSKAEELRKAENDILTIKQGLKQDAALFTSMYNFLRQQMGYSIGLFTKYLKMFPETTECIAFILDSVNLQTQYMLKLHFIMESDLQRCAPKDKQLLELIQTLLQTKDHFAYLQNDQVLTH